MRGKKRGKGHGRKGFWRQWHEERDRLWEDSGSPPIPPGFHGPPPIPPHKRVRFWREHFHNFTGAWPEEHWAFGGRRFRPWHKGQDDYNPFVASMMSKGGGLLPLIVLHLLSQESRYGNEIMELISKRTGGQWAANPGAIYPLLTMMEEEGLISGAWADPRKRTMRRYRLTPSGEKELVRMIAIVKPKLEETVVVLQELAVALNGEDEEE